MIFERFYKTDKSRSRDKNGMGLGLYLVRTILKFHGGDIAVSSAVGQFCRFEFYIPSPRRPQAEGHRLLQAEGERPPGGRERKKGKKEARQEQREPERSKEDDGRPEE